ncbi:MAG TPA: hypothetical protein VI524_15645, partial [Anaerolineales bacterium]|nr:hypothetical protein [Anaerolineales bacterium]
SSTIIYAGQRLWVPNVPTRTPIPGVTTVPDFPTSTNTSAPVETTPAPTFTEPPPATWTTAPTTSLPPTATSTPPTQNQSSP